MIKNIINKLFKKEKSKITKDIKIEIKGTLGEARQEIRLHRLDREKYKSIHDIIIQNKDKTAQIDHLVVSNYGIFVIENKNFSGNIYGSENDKTWTQVMGKSRHKFYNPIHQNYGHIKVIEDITGISENIYSIIVFSDKAILKKVDINNESVKVITESNLISTITSYNNEILTNEEVKECFNKVLSSMSTIRQDKKEHIRNIKHTLEEKQKTCPRCKSELVERKGAYGKFLGCSSYPRCKYTYSK